MDIKEKKQEEKKKEERSIWKTLRDNGKNKIKIVLNDGSIWKLRETDIDKNKYTVYRVTFYIMDIARNGKKSIANKPDDSLIFNISESMKRVGDKLQKKRFKSVPVRSTNKTLYFFTDLYIKRDPDGEKGIDPDLIEGKLKEHAFIKSLWLMGKFQEEFKQLDKEQAQKSKSQQPMVSSSHREPVAVNQPVKKEPVKQEPAVKPADKTDEKKEKLSKDKKPSVLKVNDFEEEFEI